MRMYAYVSRCVFVSVKCVERVRGNLVLILCRGSYGSLFVGVVTAFACNY